MELRLYRCRLLLPLCYYIGFERGVVHGFTCVTTAVSTARVLPYRASRCYKAGPGRRVTLLDPLVALGLAAGFVGTHGSVVGGFS